MILNKKVPLKTGGWETIFSGFGPYCSGYVSFREGNEYTVVIRYKNSPKKL